MTFIDQIPILADLPVEVRNTILRFLVLVLALLVIWGSRRLLTWIVIAPLRRLTRNTHRDIDDRILAAIMTPIRLVIIAAAISVSAEILLVGDTLLNPIRTIARVLVIIAIIMTIYRMIDILAPTSRQLFAITGITIEERLIPFLRVALKVFVVTLGIVIVLQEFNYDVSGLIAGLGLGSLGVSLAAQDTIANMFGFAQIVGDRPFDVGDYIKTPDAEGIVEHVGVRSTRLRQLDQAIVSVPNNTVANSAILNWSKLSKRRVDFVLGVTYDTDSGQMKVLLDRIRTMLKERPSVQPDSVVVYFINFGDSSLDVLVRSYVTIPDWGEFTAEKELILLDVMDIVAELNLSVAFPSRSLYVENLPNIRMEDPPVIQRVEEPAPQLTDPSPTASPRERAMLRENSDPTPDDEPLESDDYKPEAPHGDAPDEGD